MVEGAPTSGIDDCDIGVMCWYVDLGESDGECAALCDQALMPDPVCPGGTICTPIFTPGQEPPGRESVGVCTPP